VYASLDPAACAGAIERLLARDPSELRARALDAALRVPTFDQHFATIFETYTSLLDEKSQHNARSRFDS
jgi:hypothetical protein